MVAINTTDSTQRIFVPLPGPTPAGDVVLRARNTTDHSVVTFNIVDWTAEAFLLHIGISLPESGFYPGEWEYTLTYTSTEGKEVTACGLMDAVRKEDAGVVQYQTETKYKQYGAEE